MNSQAGAGRALGLRLPFHRAPGGERSDGPPSDPGGEPAMLTGTAVLGETTIPGREQDVRQARAFVHRVLGHCHPCTDVACLLVSELVTNAVQHTESRLPGGAVSLIILDMAGAIRVEVTDEGSSRSVPVVKDDVFATDGRGLYLVQSLADDWGYQHDTAGTTVWFRLPS